MYMYILKIRVYLQILFDVNLNFIEQFDFLEEIKDIEFLSCFAVIQDSF